MWVHADESIAVISGWERKWIFQCRSSRSYNIVKRLVFGSSCQKEQAQYYIKLVRKTVSSLRYLSFQAYRVLMFETMMPMYTQPIKCNLLTVMKSLMQKKMLPRHLLRLQGIYTSELSEYSTIKENIVEMITGNYVTTYSSVQRRISFYGSQRLSSPCRCHKLII